MAGRTPSQAFRAYIEPLQQALHCITPHRIPVDGPYTVALNRGDPVILAGQTVLRPRGLHKAHNPTGPVSLPAVVRLAISEFGIAPRRPDWDEALRRAEAGLGL